MKQDKGHVSLYFVPYKTHLPHPIPGLWHENAKKTHSGSLGDSKSMPAVIYGEL